MASRRAMILTALTILAAPAAPAATLDKITSTGEIVIGYREASPPFSSMGGNGKPEGYSIDLCMRIVTWVNLRTEVCGAYRWSSGDVDLDAV